MLQRTRIMSLAAALVMTALVARDARAGVVIVTESEAPDAIAKGSQAAKPAKPGKTSGDTKYSGRLYVDGDRVRMQGTSSEGGQDSSGTVIFRPDPEALLVLNGDQKSYFEMTRADAKRIGQTIDMARAQMQAQMEKMTPEQRATIEQALSNFGGDMAKGGKKAPPEPAKAISTGTSDTISGYACRGYDIVRGAKKIAEACVASWADLGLAPDDVAGLRKLAAFQQQMFAEVNLGTDAAPGIEAFEVMDQIKGFPLRVRTMVDGKRPTVMRVVQVERKDIDPKVFQVPAGYTRRSTPGG